MVGCSKGDGLLLSPQKGEQYMYRQGVKTNMFETPEYSEWLVLVVKLWAAREVDRGHITEPWSLYSNTCNRKVHKQSELSTN